VDRRVARKRPAQITTIDPTFAAPYNQIGYIHIRNGDYAKAEQAMKQYVAARSDRPNPYDSYAELLLRMGRFDESIAQYSKALEKDPSFLASLTGIGHNYLFKGDYAKARETYTRMSDQALTPPDKAEGLSWTAVSYVHEGKTSEALAALEQQRALAVKENLVPNAIGTHLDAAFVLSEAGKPTEARNHFDQAWTTLDSSQLPERVKANFRREVHMGRALVAAQTKDFTTAQAEAEKARALMTPELPAAVTRSYERTLGLIAFRQGDLDQALRHFKKTDPEDVYTMFYTAEAMRMKGDAPGAAALFKKVANWNQNSLAYAMVRSKAVKNAGS
jgi:tetratricopeptide (TPR) repeat protein